MGRLSPDDMAELLTKINEGKHNPNGSVLNPTVLADSVGCSPTTAIKYINVPVHELIQRGIEFSDKQILRMVDAKEKVFGHGVAQVYFKGILEAHAERDGKPGAEPKVKPEKPKAKKPSPNQKKYTLGMHKGIMIGTEKILELINSRIPNSEYHLDAEKLGVLVYNESPLANVISIKKDKEGEEIFKSHDTELKHRLNGYLNLVALVRKHVFKPDPKREMPKHRPELKFISDGDPEKRMNRLYLQSKEVTITLLSALSSFDGYLKDYQFAKENKYSPSLVNRIGKRANSYLKAAATALEEAKLVWGKLEKWEPLYFFESRTIEECLLRNKNNYLQAIDAFSKSTPLKTDYDDKAWREDIFVLSPLQPSQVREDRLDAEENEWERVERAKAERERQLKARMGSISRKRASSKPKGYTPPAQKEFAQDGYLATFLAYAKELIDVNNGGQTNYKRKLEKMFGFFPGTIKLILNGKIKPNEKFLQGISKEFNVPYKTLDSILSGKIPAPEVVEAVKPKTETSVSAQETSKLRYHDFHKTNS